MATKTMKEVETRYHLLSAITKLEEDAEWTEIEELRERHGLLSAIKDLEEDSEWTDIEELRERCNLLGEIRRLEENVDWSISTEKLQERATTLQAIEEAQA
jgi:hypothetical protein